MIICDRLKKTWFKTGSLIQRIKIRIIYDDLFIRFKNNKTIQDR